MADETFATKAEALVWMAQNLCREVECKDGGRFRVSYDGVVEYATGSAAGKKGGFVPANLSWGSCLRLPLRVVAPAPATDAEIIAYLESDRPGVDFGKSPYSWTGFVANILRTRRLP